MIAAHPAPRTIIGSQRVVITVAGVIWLIYTLTILSGFTLGMVGEILYRLPVVLSALVTVQYVYHPRVRGVARCLFVSNTLFIITSYWVDPVEISQQAVIFTLYAIWYCFDLCLLLPLLPVRQIPLNIILRNAANVIIAMSIIEVFFNIILPLLFPTTWGTSFMGRMSQFRLDTSIAIAGGYIALGQHLGGLTRQAKMSLVVGLISFVCIDGVMVVALLVSEQTISTDVRFNPFLSYGLGGVAICAALVGIAQNNQTITWKGPAKLGQTETLRQSLTRSGLIIALLGGLIILNPSQGHNIWFVIALIGREMLSRYERELFVRQQVELQASLAQKNLEISNLHDSRMRDIDEAAHDLGHALVQQQAAVDQAIFDLETLYPDTSLTDYQNRLEKGIQYQRHVLDELRATARQARGDRIALEYQLTDVGACIQHVVSGLHPQFTAKGCCLTYTSMRNTPVMAMCDPLRISRVIHNLAINGLRALSPGGQVSIVLDADDKLVSCQVSDTGVGFDPDYLHVLQRTHYAGSSGVGLPFCARVLNLHHGTMQIALLARGTQVTVQFPLSPEEHGIL